MGRQDTKHHCILGGFARQGFSIEEVDDKMVDGQRLWTEFAITEAFVNFVEHDVLPRIQATSRFVAAKRIGHHVLFLVHDDDIEDAGEALRVFARTLCGMVNNLETEDPEKFMELKHGSDVPTRRPLRFDSEPDPTRDAFAIHSLGSWDTSGYK